MSYTTRVLDLANNCQLVLTDDLLRVIIIVSFSVMFCDYFSETSAQQEKNYNANISANFISFSCE